MTFFSTHCFSVFDLLERLKRFGKRLLCFSSPSSDLNNNKYGRKKSEFKREIVFVTKYVNYLCRQCCFTLTRCQSVSTFESEVQNSLSTLEPHSMDSLGHQHCTKKLSPKIALHYKVLCERYTQFVFCHTNERQVQCCFKRPHLSFLV